MHGWEVVILFKTVSAPESVYSLNLKIFNEGAQIYPYLISFVYSNEYLFKTASSTDVAYRKSGSSVSIYVVCE